MPLEEGQWQVRDLVLGPDTPYRLMDEANPFTLTVRADQSGPRAWGHGSWSGAEWATERVVPIRLLLDAEPDAGQSHLAAWREAHLALAAAFAPVGDAAETVELRFVFGGTEYLLLGRPRMVEPDLSLSATGRGFTRAAFVAQDPRIYSGTLNQGSTGLPLQSGGLTVPLIVPFTIDGVLSGGQITAVNDGTTDSALTARIDGPVAQPQIVVQPPDGDLQRIRFEVELKVGQWLDVDTAARSALLNGLPEASQRGRATWDMEPYPLAPGANTIRFLAGDHNEDAELTVTWRSAYW